MITQDQMDRWLTKWQSILYYNMYDDMDDEDVYHCEVCAYDMSQEYAIICVLCGGIVCPDCMQDHNFEQWKAWHIDYYGCPYTEMGYDDDDLDPINEPCRQHIKAEHMQRR